jgi:glycosyltransferase involved in cell wall biosynthesis
VVRNGTPWPVRAAPAEPPLSPVIGCASRLSAWKGQDVLLEAIALLGRPDLTVELMGSTPPKDGPYAEALTRRASTPDLAGRVRFLGHVDDPLDRMRTWTVSVVPSTDPDPAPLSVLEAMSVGVPLVATDHGGASEVVGDAGLLVPPRDAEALATALQRLLDDAGLWHRCARAGPKAVADAFTLHDSLERLLGVMSSVAGGTWRPHGG